MELSISDLRMESSGDGARKTGNYFGNHRRLNRWRQAPQSHAVWCSSAQAQVRIYREKSFLPSLPKRNSFTEAQCSWRAANLANFLTVRSNLNPVLPTSMLYASILH